MPRKRAGATAHNNAGVSRPPHRRRACEYPAPRSTSGAAAKGVPTTEYVREPTAQLFETLRSARRMWPSASTSTFSDCTG